MNLQTISKAVAGALAGAIVAFLMKQNVVITDELNNAIEVLLGAIITGVVVYFAPRNKEK